MNFQNQQKEKSFKNLSWRKGKNRRDLGINADIHIVIIKDWINSSDSEEYYRILVDITLGMKKMQSEKDY